MISNLISRNIITIGINERNMDSAIRKAFLKALPNKTSKDLNFYVPCSSECNIDGISPYQYRAKLSKRELNAVRNQLLADGLESNIFPFSHPIYKEYENTENRTYRMALRRHRKWVKEGLYD